MHTKCHPFAKSPHGVGRAHGTYAIYANRQDTGDVTVQSTLNKELKPMASPALQQSSAISNVLDKYNFSTILDGTESPNDDEFQCFFGSKSLF